MKITRACLVLGPTTLALALSGCSLGSAPAPAPSAASASAETPGAASPTTATAAPSPAATTALPRRLEVPEQQSSDLARTTLHGTGTTTAVVEKASTGKVRLSAACSSTTSQGRVTYTVFQGKSLQDPNALGDQAAQGVLNCDGRVSTDDFPVPSGHQVRVVLSDVEDVVDAYAVVRRR